MLQRDIAQWLERGNLQLSLSVVRLRTPLGAGFSEKYHVVFLGKALHPQMRHSGESEYR